MLASASKVILDVSFSLEQKVLNKQNFMGGPMMYWESGRKNLSVENFESDSSLVSNISISDPSVQSFPD